MSNYPIDESVSTSSEKMRKMQTEKYRKRVRIIRVLKENITGYLCILPFLIALFVFTLYPIVQSLYDSFWEYTILEERINFGLSQYTRALKSDEFWMAWKNSLTYTALFLLTYLPAEFIVALMVNSRKKGIYFLRIVWYLPTVIPQVSNVLLWGYVLNPKYGIGNPILSALGLPTSQFFQGSDSAMMTMVVLNLFGAAAGMVFMVSALRSVPDTVYEAAKIDGSGFWRTFFTITLPLMAPYMAYKLFSSITTGINNFTPFLFVGIGGGPDGVLFLKSMMTYKYSYLRYEIGYVSAMAYINLILMLPITIFSLRNMRNSTKDL